MRVLLAIDGSAWSQRTVELAKRLSWPAATRIRVLAAADSDSHDEAALRAVVDAAAAQLDAPSRSVEAIVRRGRAATVILGEASEAVTDLIIIGSRGRGPFTTMLLGSVSAEVVDGAPCPVLVARGTTASRLVIADDGSEPAHLITDVLARWRLLQGREARVVSVARDDRRLYPDELGHWGEPSDIARHIDWAEDCVERLRECGISGRTEVRLGDPAHQIVEAAVESGSDLIITGSRGRSGVRRMLLGSVARNVLLHAPCSVLVIRRPLQRMRSEEQVHAPVVASALS